MTQFIINPNGDGVKPDHAGLVVDPQEDTLSDLVGTVSTVDRRWSENASNIMRKAVILAEISPLNELARISVFAASQVSSNNPLVGALAYGGATLAIESAAAIAAAGVINDKSKGSFLTWAQDKWSKGEEKNSGIPLTAEIGLALAGGSVVAMEAQQIADPSRTEKQNRKYGLLTSAWLAGVCAIQGALMSEGIHTLEPTKIGAALVAVGGTYIAARRMKANHSVPEVLGADSADTLELVDYDPKHKFTSRLVSPYSAEAEDGLDLEQAVWAKHNYGDELEAYSKFVDQSRVFVAYDGEKTIGIARIFEGGPSKPPFLELNIDDDDLRIRLEEGCENGTVEELATSAVDPNSPIGVVTSSLWRLAYRDAINRGVKHWGIIMEPRRVEIMNKRYGFNFKKIGPTEFYQGGECAAHVMDLDEVQRHIKEHKPTAGEWFVNEPLRNIPESEITN